MKWLLLFPLAACAQPIPTTFAWNAPSNPAGIIAYELEWATTSTRTGGGTKYASASNGIYTVNSDYLDLFRNDSAWSTATWQIDDIKISNTGWPE